MVIPLLLRCCSCWPCPLAQRRADGAFCVFKPDQSPAAMQKAIDYACWRSADCTQIMQSGACYQPSTIGGGGEILRRRREQTAHDGAERTARD
ncbi:Os06g0170100 [Oryza sativa Japonica Group]|uniref:Os06g0170100 protein n=1 Tax=Oryza sativa subsp. japonica TaxID=39947 RepID=C7J3C7_ORYSJ|nr:Os06g0170100 [Oryza sativa Japonica Group]|eukprot:NP_001174619.1 Os06g0170100 [Oryza sativa Japonica Group]